ncbi:MAG TPA: glycosyltransferase family 4 protein [Bryobacteraceae bacterium]|nr:glycosyltransferase family 4 protein [Bryobacteraceae bacterium]
MEPEPRLRLVRDAPAADAPAEALRPVSVALICQSYPPVVGGSEIEAQRVCAGLLKRGHKVEVICEGAPPMPPVRRWKDPLGINVRLIGAGFPGAIRGYVYALGVAWILLRNRASYDVVYFLMSGLQLATGLPAARVRRIPILMKFSGSSLIRRMKDSWLGRLELSLLNRWADHILVLNDGMVAEAEEVGLDTRRIAWMPNPVDMDDFRPPTREEKTRLRREFNLPVDAPVVLFAGRLAPEKELLSLIAAFRQVLEHRADAILALAGDGPSRTELEASAGSLMGFSIRFTGMASVRDVRRLMQASDIFALVSSLEGLPVSLIEAMAVGLPSVVSDIPANLQLVESGTHGLAVPVGDSAAVAQSLLGLMNDQSACRTMGESARARVKATYATESVVLRYERLFAGMLRL